jgi:carbon storage regulator
MLVLTRKPDEKIMIGHDIEIVVIGVNGVQVSLGVKAPREIAIHREEIYREIEQANRGGAWVARENLDIQSIAKNFHLDPGTAPLDNIGNFSLKNGNSKEKLLTGNGNKSKSFKK